MANTTNTTSKAMTSREFFEVVMSANVPENIKAYAQAQIKKLDDRNDKRKSAGSKKAQENEVIKVALLNAMETDVVYTAAQLNELKVEGITSTSKASALARQLVEVGELTETEVKIKGRGKVKGYIKESVDETEDETEDETKDETEN